MPVLLLLLGLATAAPAVPVDVPADQAAAWTAAAALQGWTLGPARGEVWVRIEAREPFWNVVAKGRDGVIRSRPVPAPRTEEDREDILALARGLLRAGDRPALSVPLVAPAPEPPPPPRPTTRAPAPPPSPAPTEDPPAEAPDVADPPEDDAVAEAPPVEIPPPPPPPEPWSAPGPPQRLDLAPMGLRARVGPPPTWGLVLTGGVGFGARRLALPTPRLTLGLIADRGDWEGIVEGWTQARGPLVGVEEGANLSEAGVLGGVQWARGREGPVAGAGLGAVSRRYGIEDEKVQRLGQIVAQARVGGRFPVARDTWVRMGVQGGADLGWTLITGDGEAITLGRLRAGLYLTIARRLAGVVDAE